MSGGETDRKEIPLKEEHTRLPPADPGYHVVSFALCTRPLFHMQSKLFQRRVNRRAAPKQISTNKYLEQQLAS